MVWYVYVLFIDSVSVYICIYYVYMNVCMYGRFMVARASISVYIYGMYSIYEFVYLCMYEPYVAAIFEHGVRVAVSRRLLSHR